MLLKLQQSSNKVLALYNYRALEAGELQLEKVSSPDLRYVLFIFIVRQHTDARDIDIAILSVRPSVCLSVRDIPVSHENGLTYHSVEEIHSVGTISNVETS